MLYKQKRRGEVFGDTFSFIFGKIEKIRLEVNIK